MKNAKELLQLPVISISEGKHLGIIKDLVINPAENVVDYLIVVQGEWGVRYNALSYEKVVGVGEFAVVIEQKDSFIELDEIPYLNKMIGLIGSQAITNGGKHVGVISDYYFNEENGHLENLLIYSANNKLLLPIENVISLGKEHVITNESLSEMVSTLELEEQNGEKVGSKSSKKETLRGILNDLILNELPNLSNQPSKDEETDN